ncbi:ankyrin repeat domain-containing protein, partial [Delftia acidovorans]|uniref:ankyrin repeat domain-containing protein n=1 Tax=Delftia acidovorans TaxID=80866 RepID=UPI0030ECCE8D
TAIDAVIEDFQKGRPMDRLVCGDVGFGKTEVALRSAFVAAMNGNAAAINFLLEHGADINLANAQGWTPLYLTVKARTMEKGTMPNPRVDQAGLFKAIEFMVDHKVDINARIRGNTEVHNGIAATWLREAGATAFLRAACSCR